MKKFLRSILEPLKLLWRTWLKLAHFIGKVNTMILLTLFYVIIIGIVKLITLLGREDLLDERWKDRPSYWQKREPKPFTQEAFLKPY